MLCLPSRTPGNEETEPQEGNYQADFEDTVNSLKRQLEVPCPYFSIFLFTVSYLIIIGSTVL